MAILSDAELLALVLLGLSVLFAGISHAILWLASYRVELLFVVVAKVVPQRYFASIGPCTQWLILFILLLWPVFLGLAVWQIQSEDDRLAMLGGSITFACMMGSFAIVSATVDQFQPRVLTRALALLFLLSLLVFFALFVWEASSFSFIGASSVLLVLSALPGVFVAFETGKALEDELAAQGKSAPSFGVLTHGLLPGATTKPVTWRFGLLTWCASIGLLILYGFTIRERRSDLEDPDHENIGFVLAAGVFILDLVIWNLWRLRLLRDAIQTAVLLVLARISACIWGENYWLLGHSCCFLVLSILLSHVSVGQWLPPPDFSKDERRQAAAQVLEELDKRKASTASSSAAAASAAASAAGAAGDDPAAAAAAAAAAEPQPMGSGCSRGLFSCLQQPIWTLVALFVAFGLEIGVVAKVVDLPPQQVCSACETRPQWSYAAAAAAAAIFYGISLILFRKAQYEAKHDSIWTKAKFHILAICLLWTSLSVYLSWLVNSWSFSVHAVLLPVMLGLFSIGYQRWVADDFELLRSHPEPVAGGVAVPAAPPATGDPAAAAAAAAAPDASSHRIPQVPLPESVKFWLAALSVWALHTGGLLIVMDKENKWIAACISTSILSLALTFLSNRHWFGTLRSYPEQPVGWLCILIVLGLGSFAASTLWDFEGATFLYSVPIIFPAVYSNILAVQMVRDTGWTLTDPATMRFVKWTGGCTCLAYIAFWGVVAIWSVYIALFGLFGTAALSVGVIAAAVWLRGRLRTTSSSSSSSSPPSRVNSIMASTKAQIALLSTFLLCILVSAAAVVLYFESVFGGFTVICLGVFVLLSGFSSLLFLEAHNKPVLSRITATPASSLLFPAYRMDGGHLKFAGAPFAASLVALMVAGIWGLAAVASWQRRPYLGAVTGSLALIFLVILALSLAQRNESSMRKALLGLPQELVTTALVEVLDKWQGEGHDKLADGSLSDLDDDDEDIEPSTPAPDSPADGTVVEPPKSSGPSGQGKKRKKKVKKSKVADSASLTADLSPAKTKSSTDLDAASGAAVVVDDPTGDGDGDDETKSNTSEVKARQTETRLEAASGKLFSLESESREAYFVSFHEACCGRFNVVPAISFLYHILSPRADGCLSADTPANAFHSFQTLSGKYQEWMDVFRKRQEFSAQLQLTIRAAHAQWLLEQEAAFQEFLRQFGGPSLSLEEFRKLPTEDRVKLNKGWKEWAALKAAEEREARRQRRLTEIATRKRFKEQLKLKEQAIKDLAEALDQSDLAVLRAALDAATELGLEDDVVEVSQAKFRLSLLDSAESQLNEALDQDDLEKLEEAIGLVEVAGLDHPRLEEAKARALVLKQQREAALISKQEAEKRLIEEKRRQKLAEAEEARRKERESAKQELEAAVAGGQLDALKSCIEAAKATDLPDHEPDVVTSSEATLQEWQSAEEHLQSAVASGDLQQLEDAVQEAQTAKLQSKSLDDAQAAIEQLKLSLSAAEEARRQEELDRRAAELRQKAQRARQEILKQAREAAEVERQKQLALQNQLQDAEASGDISTLKEALEQVKQAGLSSSSQAFVSASQKLADFEEAVTLMESALAASSKDALKTSVAKARATGLKHDLVGTCEGRLAQLLKEEKAKAMKAKADKVTGTKPTGPGIGTGAASTECKVDVVALKASMKDGHFTDKAWPKSKYGSKAQAFEVKRFKSVLGGQKPQLVVNGINADDINQGMLGDCWFLSALACAASANRLQPVMIYQDEEAGMYVVRFFKDGAIRDIVVDDFFPTVYGRLAFASSSNHNEAWPQVLEKAYAKLHGSYDAIVGGFVSDGLVDLTGGIGSILDLTDEGAAIRDGSLWEKLLNWTNNAHLLGCGSQDGPDTEVNSSGIVKGHAYSILRLVQVDQHRLLRLRNPWGSKEWKGKWSDKDKESWTQRMRKKLDYKDAEDGSFWMAFEDFVVQFRNIYVCRVFDDSDWKSVVISSEWKGKTAGGCSNFPTYKNNPHFRLKVNQTRKVVIVLAQADPRIGSIAKADRRTVAIGFKMFEPTRGDAPRPSRNSVLSSGTYSHDREVYCEDTLSPCSAGDYFLVPTTFNPNQERGFRIKVLWQGNLGDIECYPASE